MSAGRGNGASCLFFFFFFFFATAMVRIQMIEAVNSYTLGFGPHVGESGASIGAH